MKKHFASQNPISLSGWLIADMLLGLAMIFLISNTRSAPTRTPTPTLTITATASPKATHTPAPTPTKLLSPTPPTGLELVPYKFRVQGDFDKIIADDPIEIDKLLRQISPNLTGYLNRRAGLVITLGFHTSRHISGAINYGKKVNKLLCRDYPTIFQCDKVNSGTVMKVYWWNDDPITPVGTLEFEIYFYNR